MVKYVCGVGNTRKRAAYFSGTVFIYVTAIICFRNSIFQVSRQFFFVVGDQTKGSFQDIDDDPLIFLTPHTRTSLVVPWLSRPSLNIKALQSQVACAVLWKTLSHNSTLHSPKTTQEWMQINFCTPRSPKNPSSSCMVNQIIPADFFLPSSDSKQSIILGHESYTICNMI